MCTSLGRNSAAALVGLLFSNRVKSVSVKSVGVGCEPPHLRSIFRILRIDLVPVLFIMCLAVRSFRVCY